MKKYLKRLFTVYVVLGFGILITFALIFAFSPIMLAVSLKNGYYLLLLLITGPAVLAMIETSDKNEGY